MQFADSAGKFASGAQFCASVVQIEQSNPEITFVKLLKKVCLLFKHIAKGNRMPFAIAPKVI
jgi:hypothetical protein